MRHFSVPVRAAITTAGVLAALLLIDIGLTLHNVWPTFGVRWPGEASIELAVLVLALAAHGAWRGRLGQGARWGLAVLLSFLVLARYADVTAPALFGRHIDLYWDLPHLPNVVAMATAAMPGWQVAAMAAGLLLLAAAMILTARWCVATLDAACGRRGPRQALAGVAGLAVAAFTVGMSSDRLGWEYRFAIPVSRVIGEQAVMLAEAVLPMSAHAAHGGEPLPASDFAALGGGDVYLVFFESYGAVAYEEPDDSGAIAAAQADWRAAVTATGRTAAAAYVDSPTYGGASWLAHLTALSGVTVGDNAAYHRLLKSGRETLTDRFRAAGYRAVGLMPGVRQEWPEGAAMRFDAILDAAALDYAGPAYGWWDIPDQYSLDTLWRREIAPRDRAPLFVFFPTITSHFPFAPVPPYVADWDRMAADPPFPEPPQGSAPDPRQVGAAYRRTIAYDLRLAAGFVEQRMPEDAVLIVIGDHQPPAVVSGRKDSDAVPVHVVAANPSLLQPFLDAGFRPGLQPEGPAIGPMRALTPLILGAFDGAHAD